MATKKTEDTSIDIGPSKDELEKVDMVKSGPDAAPDTKQKLVNMDNGTEAFHDSTVEKLTAKEIVQGAPKMDNIAPKGAYVDQIETPMVTREKRVITESLTKAQLQAHIDDMKANRPEVYEARKEDLERQLKELPA